MCRPGDVRDVRREKDDSGASLGCDVVIALRIGECVPGGCRDYSSSTPGNMKPCSEMLLEVTVYCGKVRDQRGCHRALSIAI